MKELSVNRLVWLILLSFKVGSHLDVSSLGDILLKAEKLSLAAKFKISKSNGF